MNIYCHIFYIHTYLYTRYPRINLCVVDRLGSVGGQRSPGWSDDMPISSHDVLMFNIAERRQAVSAHRTPASDTARVFNKAVYRSLADL